MGSQEDQLKLFNIPFLQMSFSILCWCLYARLISIVLTCFRDWATFSDYIKSAVSGAAVSASHGVLCGIIGSIIMYQCKHDVIKAETPLVGQYVFVGCGYFIRDLVTMYCSFSLKLKESSKQGNFTTDVLSFLRARTLMVFHHLAMVFFFFPTLVRCSTMGNFMAGCFFIMEVSSLFVNLRFILIKVGLKNSMLYFINGLLMVCSFTACRVLVFPFMYACFTVQQSSLLSLSYIETLQRVPCICHCSCLLLMTLQVHWLCSILKGFRKEVFSSSEKVIKKNK